MKIAHLSDLHFCSKHLPYANRAMVQAVREAIESGAELCVISGDSFDSSMPIHEPAVSAYLRHMLTLAEQMSLVVLQGTPSHDRPGSLDILKWLPSRYPILVADEPGQWWLSVDRKVIWNEAKTGGEFFGLGSILISTLPSLNKSDPEIMSIGAADWVRNTLSSWAPLHAAAREHGIPSILVTHGTINGCLTESKYAMISPDHEFHLDTLTSLGADAVMIGHIHKHQSWRDQDCTIAYPGSLARLVHGHHDDTGYLMWNVRPERAQFEFKPVTSRNLLEIEFDGTPDMDELAALAKQVTDDTYVRIRWSVDQEHAHSIDKRRIRELFEGAANVKLEGTVNPVQSVRAAGIGKAVSLEEKLAYYCSTTGDEDSLDGLKDRLRMLREMEVEEVVKKVVGNGAAEKRKVA